jgi:putative intracellular protease/amidase
VCRYEQEVKMVELNQLLVAIIATDGFEESELTEPRKALEAAGAKVEVVSEKTGEIQGYKHHEKSVKVRVDSTLKRRGRAAHTTRTTRARCRRSGSRTTSATRERSGWTGKRDAGVVRAGSSRGAPLRLYA